MSDRIKLCRDDDNYSITKKQCNFRGTYERAKIININSCLATSYEAEFIEIELCVRFFFCRSPCRD